MGILDFLGGAKPIRPPAIYGEGAADAAGEYRWLLQQLQGEIQPFLRELGEKFPDIVRQTQTDIMSLRRKYMEQFPDDREFAEQGRELERQTLDELQARGSEERQNEFGIRASERVGEILARQREDRERQRFGYDEAGGAIYGTSDAQAAAAAAIAENEARRAERYRGEDARLGALGAIRGTYSEGETNRLGQIIAADQMLKENDLDGAQGIADIYGQGGRFRNDYVDPALRTAFTSADTHHRAEQGYKNAKNSRFGRILGNVAKIGAAAITGNPALLASVSVGGSATGAGSTQPFDFLSYSPTTGTSGHIKGRADGGAPVEEARPTWIRGRQKAPWIRANY